MTVAHQPWLVALSLLMAFQGSYVGLHLARQIGEATGLRHRRLIASSALSLALAIWTMHFIGMLAVDLPVAADFLVLPTLLSFLICVLVVGVAVFIVSPEWVSGRRLVAAALFMGGGIVVMHHLGMLALQKGFHLGHDPFATGVSALIGVAASGMALWLGFGDRAPRSLPGSAALLALGISAMHYTAMSGTSLHPHAVEAVGTQPALSPGLLAVVVSVVAFFVSGLFLLTLVPIRPAPEVAVLSRAAPGGLEAAPPRRETRARRARSPRVPSPRPRPRPVHRLLRPIRRFCRSSAKVSSAVSTSCVSWPCRRKRITRSCSTVKRPGFAL
ncbi:MHYT domain-containing protein [Methyloraptor flagellatus]|uniref:MHYT domain-containing protein n=1 Tax=Methyloraptor flagellatus TaxID=3162530 RepID=A0AAU7XAS0_9HYPH